MFVRSAVVWWSQSRPALLSWSNIQRRLHLRPQRGQTAGVCFNRDGKQSGERWTGRTHSGVAQMIFLGGSRAGHVVFPSDHFLSFEWRQTWGQNSILQGWKCCINQKMLQYFLRIINFPWRRDKYFTPLVNKHNSWCAINGIFKKKKKQMLWIEPTMKFKKISSSVHLDWPLLKAVSLLRHHSSSTGASAGRPLGPLAPPVRGHL